MDQPIYHFGPLERRGILLGLNAMQLLILAGGGVASIMSLSLGATGISLLIAAVVGGSALAMTFMNKGGRPVHQWLGVGTAWITRRYRGGERYVPISKQTGNAAAFLSQSPLPASLHGISLLSAPIKGGEIGVVKDSVGFTWTAALAVKGRSFALIDDNEKARMLRQWGDALSGFARDGSPIKRIQWVERTFTDPGDQMAAYMREAIGQPINAKPVQSYLQLVGAAGPVSQQHETFVVVQLDAKAGARAMKQLGGGETGAVAALTRELTGLSSRLQSADLEVAGILSPRLLAQAIRVSYDPASRPSIAKRGLDDPTLGGVALHDAWPHKVKTDWNYFQTDSAVHATYWIAEWPRTDVGPDFLAPLLLQTWCHRTIAVTLETIPPLRAQREVEHAMTADITDEELRSRAGFRTTARRRRESEQASRREEELSMGYADIRFSGYITVTGEDLEELENACQETEQMAAQSRLVLRRMVGEQDVAFTYTLPFARGLA
jgi:type VII secretion protein EccE